jgi:hypothetical protein
VTDREQIDELNTGLLLYIPYRAMEARVFKAMAAAGYDDFTPAQARVFQRIAPGGSRLTDLTEQASITKQSAGFLVDQLERPATSSAFPTPPMPAHGWYGSPNVAARRSPLRRPSSPRSKLSGPSTSASGAWDSSARYSPGCVRSPTRTPHPHVDI